MGSPVAEFFVFYNSDFTSGFCVVFFFSLVLFSFFSLSLLSCALFMNTILRLKRQVFLFALCSCVVGHLYHAKFASLLLVYNSISLFFSSSKRETLLLLAFSFSSYFMIIYITRMFSSTSRFTFHVLLRPSTTGSFIASFLLDVLTFTSSFFLLISSYRLFPSRNQFLVCSHLLSRIF